MSDDYSSFERDYFKKSKRREDFKQKKTNSKQVKVYEPKSDQKSVRNQDYADEPDQTPRYEDDAYDNSSKCYKNDTYKIYSSKMSSASKTNQGDKNKFKVWKKESVKTNKNNGESQKDKSRKTSIEWVPSSKVTLFFEKPAVVNNSNPTPLPPEVKHSSGEDSSIASVGRSTNATDDRKSMETFDFTQNRQDPIKELKNLMRKESQNEKKDSKTGTVKQESMNEADTTRSREDNKELCDDNLEKDDKQEDEEINQANYSDIDAQMEKKLLNNDIELNEDSDLFNQENQVESKEKIKEFEGLENKERPVWEDLDTNKVLEDIKKFDHLSLFSQDIKSTWKDKLSEAGQRKSGQNVLQVTQLQEENPNKKTSEDDEDYFDRIFSFKFLDEPPAKIPTLSNGWSKSLSEKEISPDNMMKNVPLTSQSFDFELLNRKDKNHASLPAFRNCYIQKDNSFENYAQGPKNNIPTTNNQNSSNNITYSRIIFQNLMPNSDAKIWYYKDLEGVLQGPFSSKMMDDWHSKGYLPLDLDITIGSRSGYRKIKDLAEVAGKTQSLTEQINYPYTQYNASKYPTRSSNKEAKSDIIQKNTFQSIICENSCPNIRSPDLISNKFLMSTEMRINNPACYPEQNYLNKPLFTSDFGSLKGSNRTMIPSFYKTQSMPPSSQIQGFDNNRFEANSNQLRNLPR